MNTNTHKYNEQPEKRWIYMRKWKYRTDYKTYIPTKIKYSSSYFYFIRDSISLEWLNDGRCSLHSFTKTMFDVLKWCFTVDNEY